MPVCRVIKFKKGATVHVSVIESWEPCWLNTEELARQPRDDLGTVDENWDRIWKIAGRRKHWGIKDILDLKGITPGDKSFLVDNFLTETGQEEFDMAHCDYLDGSPGERCNKNEMAWLRRRLP